MNNKFNFLKTVALTALVLISFSACNITEKTTTNDTENTSDGRMSEKSANDIFENRVGSFCDDEQRIYNNGRDFYKQATNESLTKEEQLKAFLSYVGSQEDLAQEYKEFDDYLSKIVDPSTSVVKLNKNIHEIANIQTQVAQELSNSTEILDVDKVKSLLSSALEYQHDAFVALNKIHSGCPAN